jgi:2-polyprenyl-3-methyl-5-hydroxy-6-metoxy-1,4-benzoquinol methylase
MKYEMISKKAECPVCTQNESRLYWSVDSDTAARHYVSPIIAPQRFTALVSQIESLWRSETCDIVECKNCSFVFSHPYVAGDKLFYDLAYERSSYPTWKWEFQVALDKLLPMRDEDFRLLEVGAGNGAFLKQVLEKVATSDQILAIEYSEFGKERIEALGVQCLSIDVRQLTDESYKEFFTVICMFQVLEHMDDLDALFQHIRFLLKPGGSLIVAVPNNLWIEFNEMNGALLDMPPNHIGRWNRKCFEEVSRRHGFSIRNHAIEDFSFVHMLKQFSTYRFLKSSQRTGSLAEKVVGMKPGRIRSLFLAVGAGVSLLFALPLILKFNQTLGDSQMIHFIK